MKILCPRCKEIARTVYLQGTDKGRTLFRISGVLFCPSENAFVRLSDRRILGL